MRGREREGERESVCLDVGWHVVHLSFDNTRSGPTGTSWLWLRHCERQSSPYPRSTQDSSFYSKERFIHKNRLQYCMMRFLLLPDSPREVSYPWLILPSAARPLCSGVRCPYRCTSGKAPGPHVRPFAWTLAPSRWQAGSKGSWGGSRLWLCLLQKVLHAGLV